MKVVVPMAGRGSRFANSSFSRPKPLIEVLGKPMFTWAIESLDGMDYSEIIVIALKEHESQFGLRELMNKYVKVPFQLVLIDEVTEGQLCTVLAAKPLIQTSESLLIIASDTLIEGDMLADLVKEEDIDGIISVLNLPGEQWSFAKVDSDGKVIEVAEKTRISDWASTGMYYFKSGANFVEEAERLINRNERTRGEFYIMPLYQKLIDSGLNIRIAKAKNMWDMGTPEALAQFVANKNSFND
jgi:UDP-N-acetylglucosamine diphosphorylase / glucose-1-phosphate thymidylyltransferase / UDP-N-acetylgalactosamine diphosphorylase / glucosamine-1-phosphate N-acetyltransferase / galactosamine-1-phosphate N-acetyltransferase